MNRNFFLKDKAALKILSDENLKDYVARLISSVTGLNVNENNLVYCSNNINSKLSYKDKYTDVLFESKDSENDYIINIEVNYNNNHIVQNKNMNYIFQLILKQTKPGYVQKYDKIKPVIQININRENIFKENRLIFESQLMEKTSHALRSNLIRIIDVNLEYLDGMTYNEKKKLDKIAENFIIFVDNDISKLENYFKGDETMDKVVSTLKELVEDCEPLYYDHEEFHERIVRADAEEKGFASGLEKGIQQGIEKGMAQGREAGIKQGIEQGIEQGKQQNIILTATNLIKNGVSEEIILNSVDIDKKHLDEIKESLK